MAGQFRVEPAGLGSAAGRLSRVAGAVGGLDLTGPLSRAAGAVAGSSTAGRAGGLAGELAAARQALTAAVEQMGASARAASGNYTGADQAIAQGLAGLGDGSW